MSESCCLCQPVPPKVFVKSDNIALCTRHWNWWLARFIDAEDEPPCAAHLREGDR